MSALATLNEMRDLVAAAFPEAARKMIEAGDPLGRAYLEPPGSEGHRRLNAR